jgi:hypothetical protein
LFGAILCEPGVLEQCADVEIYDFTNLHLQFAFMALRNVQSRGEEVDVSAVIDELWSLGYLQVDVAQVGAAALEPEYNSELLVDIDARWLRRLAKRRRNL